MKRGTSEMEIPSGALLDELAHAAVRIALFDYGADDYENMDDPILRSTFLEFRDVFRKVLKNHASNKESDMIQPREAGK